MGISRFESQLVTAEPAKDGMKDLQGVTSKGKQLLLRHVSIFRWLPHYTKLDAVGDLVAGVTLGLTMMPQAIAYASLAGLNAQYGLYSSFMGGLVYMIFGTIKEVSIGITSLMALMTYEYTQDLPVEFVILLTFLSGCVQLVMGLLDLGELLFIAYIVCSSSWDCWILLIMGLLDLGELLFIAHAVKSVHGILVDFISEPVTSGFTTATSLIIIVSQMKGLLGLRFKSNGFVDNIWQLFKHAGEAKLWDCVMGFTTMNWANFCPFRELASLLFHFTERAKICPVHELGNDLCYPVHGPGSTKCHPTHEMDKRKTGQIKPGLPTFGLPPFSAQVGNTTYSFMGMCEKLGSGIIMVPVVGVLANVAIAKAF
uniref:SLC26A/SulP transporter domain-containing protein n=1 Tax=Timema shepardi TaxID=629360 RepID=A0A7R9B1V4_TIMSH|nr:unnamed protein product [Timema shepardi]